MRFEPTRPTLLTASVPAALVHLAPAAQAQDAPPAPEEAPVQEQEADDEAPLVEIPEGFDPSPFRREESTSPQDQMIELFHEVERRMSRSTELLFDASKGDVSKLDDLEASGLEDLGQDQDSSARAAVAGLLRASKGEGQEVLRAIDEILEIAQNQGGGT